MLLPVVKMCSQSSFKDSSDRGYPDDWEVVRADCLFTLEYGKGLSEKERVAGPYPVMGSNGVVGYHNEAAVKGPGIVVGRKGSIGAVTWVDSDFWPIDTTYYVKIRRHDVSLKWLFYELAYLNPAKFRLADVVPGLKRELVHSVKVHLPLLPEQEKIAEILSVVDSAVELVDKVIAKTERLKKGLMQTLLTKGIGHKEYKDTPIGKTPKDWGVQELGDESIADIVAGQSPPSSTYNKENRGLPFLQGKMEFGEMFPSPTTYCFEPIKIAEKNDVLLSVRAPVGDVNIAPSECCIGRGLVAIRAKVDKLNHLFLFYYLKLEGKRFEALSTGSTFKAIRIREIEKFSIPLPSIDEQQRIAEIFSEVDKKLELERREKAKLERVRRGLMDLLLTGKVRVKVD